MKRVWIVAIGALVFALPNRSEAQQTQQLPYTSTAIPMVAAVSEHAKITLPTSITWTVDDVTVATNSAPASVTIDKIKLIYGKKVRVSIQASAASFTPPQPGTITWSASDVSWVANGATWTNASSVPAGTLSNTAYQTLAESTPNPANFNTTNLVFVLAAKESVELAGSHTLNATWKVESF